MKKNLVKLLASLALGMVLLGIAPTRAEAQCSGWTNSANGGAVCFADSGCGFLWLQNESRQTVVQERWCSKDGRQVRQTQFISQRLGCC